MVYTAAVSSTATAASPELSVKAALAWAWGRFTRARWLFIGITLLLVAVNAVFAALAKSGIAAAGAQVGQLVGTVLEGWLYLGFVGMLLAAHDGKPLALSQLFAQRGVTFVSYIAGTLLYGLIVLGGFLLLVVPGIVWAIKFYYYPYAIVDEGRGPVAALRRSSELTSGQKLSLFWFFFALALINVAASFLLGVGLLVSVPVTLLAVVWSYRLLQARLTIAAAPESAPAPQN